MSQETVVILIHGIRTAAWWEGRVASILAKENNATVIPLKYGYFDALRFVCPFRFCRNGPIARLRKEIEGIREKIQGLPIVDFAHSYGTYSLSKILIENPYFKFDRVILCGSIIKESYDWSRVENQIIPLNKREAIVNECGIRDFWPVIAKSISWDYGASGTYGFGAFNVRDRFHPLTHSEFFEPEFIHKYWVPAVAGAPIEFSAVDVAGQGTPGWFALLRIPLRWVMALAAVALVAFVARPYVFPPAPCGSAQVSINNHCVEVSNLKSRNEMARRISSLLVDIKKTLDIKQGDLFPAMRAFQNQPTRRNWDEVIEIVDKLYKAVDIGLDDIGNYDSFIVREGEDVILIANDARVKIEGRFWEAFQDAQKQFKGRRSILKEMKSTTDLPEPDRVARWLNELEVLHGELGGALVPLLNLFERA